MATRFPKFSQVLSEDPTTLVSGLVSQQHMTLKLMMMLLKKHYIKKYLLHILVTLQLFSYGQLEICST